jgi:hypothetical protein
MDLLTAGALGLGAAWASGINVYAVVLTLGLLDAAGHDPHLHPRAGGRRARRRRLRPG